MPQIILTSLCELSPPNLKLVPPPLHGRTVQIDWTLLGVANYRDPSNPLRTELGDSLILLCENVSNLFIQAEKIQHEECNASAGSGQYDLNGFCTASGELRLSLTVNSQNLMNTINFENNHLYYFASYSNGRLGDANNRSINSGGQCEDGLKMVVLIGENPTTFTPDIGGNKPGDPGGDDLPIAIIAGAAGGGVTFIILIVFLCICICLCCCKKAVKVNQEEPDTTMDVKLIVTTDTTQTQINPSEGTRNATNNNTTQNRTGAASSPSQQNKASRGTVHNGCTYHKGAAQSTAGSLVADDKHVKPHNAPNTYQTAGSSVAGDKRDKPHNAPSSHRPAGSSIAGDKRDKPHNAPSSHRPAGSSIAGDKHDKPHNAPSSHRPAGSSVAGDKRDKPHNAPSSHRPAGSSIAGDKCDKPHNAPSSHRPAGSSIAGDKRDKPHNAPSSHRPAGSSVAGDKRDKPHNAPSSHRPAGSSIAGDKCDKPHNAPSSHRPAGSSIAGDKRDKPHNAPSSHRPAGSSVAGDKRDKPHNAPSSHRPAGSSVAGDKHDKPHNAPISHRPAPPPPSNTATTGLSRTQRSKNGVSYETKNDAVKL